MSVTVHFFTHIYSCHCNYLLWKY